MKNKKEEMKPAYIENILIWMVMFIGFVTLFFFVIDYASIVRIKDNMDALSDFGARSIAINGTGTDISAQLNVTSVNAINAITSGNLNCNSVANNAFQVIFITQATNSSYKFFNNQLTSRRVVFNEVNSNTVTCTLNITLSN